MEVYIDKSTNNQGYQLFALTGQTGYASNSLGEAK